MDSLFSSALATDLSSSEVSREHAVKNALRIRDAFLQFSKANVLQQSVSRTLFFSIAMAKKSTILGPNRGTTFSCCSFSGKGLPGMAGSCL